MFLSRQWREVARDLDGVIRIGAVNCEDEWMLCRQQGIRSYPTLVMYPAVSTLLHITLTTFLALFICWLICFKQFLTPFQDSAYNFLEKKQQFLFGLLERERESKYKVLEKYLPVS